MTSPPGLEIDVQRNGSETRIRITGDVDLEAIPVLQRARDESLGHRPRRLLIDLRGVSFIDSSGLKFLLEADRTAREAECELQLLPAGPAAMKVFEVTGMDQQLPFIGSDGSG